MPDHHTRLTTTDKLEEAIHRLSENHTSLSQGHQSLNSKIDSIHSSLTSQIESLFDRLTAITLQPNNTPSPNPTAHIPPSPASRYHHLKLDVPRFDGHDPLGWIFKISQFFDYQGIPELERLTIASFYMDGPALSWYQWMHRNGFFSSWPAMLQALESRFAPSFYDDPQGNLFKLQQTGSVTDYLTAFERLANRTIGIAPSSLLSCFISGLVPELRREVQALRPISLPQAIELARLQEDKLLDRRRGPRPPPHPPSPNPTSAFSPSPPPGALTPKTPSPPSLPSPKLPIKRLSAEELAVRRDQGLCYHCDDKWSPGHRCKSRLHLFIADEDILSPDPFPEPDPDPTLISQISLNAMEGSPTPQTFRLYGSIGHHRVIILVDGGSSHNFIQTRLARFLHLPTASTTPLRVMVGNGHTLDCDTVSPQITLTIQTHPFTLDLLHLPICGADIVLGVQWLKLLGPVTTDFATLTMSFTYLGRPLTLFADVPPKPSLASAHQLKRLANTHSISALFHITPLPAHSPPLPSDQHPQPLPEPITAVLTRYSSIFSEPTQLPPPRTIQHHIHLLPTASPVNVRPYRYPHYQKAEIESQITAMLNSGLIQPSQSPFSSPILLVKKKDGSWRCCIDYRALNSITVKDKFPMPTVDELLDDLGKASWFTKLDLRQGFHQIRMATSDIPKTAFRTHQGHYEFRVMPFGLCNAPSTFQSAMNDTLRPYLRKFVAVFFDDILVYSSDLPSHVSHLDTVLSTLTTHHFYLKESKCVFAQPKLNYLGHIISSAGIAPDPDKIQAMVDWPTPTSTTSLRGFLGLTGFYRKFIKGYAHIAAPLTTLLRKD